MKPPKQGRSFPEAAWPAVIAAALLVAPQVAGRATRDALFLSTFDVAALPRMTASAAVASLLATFAFSRAMAKLSPARVLPAALGASAALFLAEWGLALAAPRLAAVAVYLHQALLGAVLISGFWSLVNERFDPHTAKHAMGAIGAGASLGGVAGGLLAWGASKLVSVPAMLPALAAASLLGLASVLRVRAAGVAALTAEGTVPPPPASGPDRSALRLIREAPYLRSLALLVGLGAVLEAVLDYLLGAAAAASFARGAPLMSFFALFHAGSGLLALTMQAMLVRPLLQRLGLAGTLAIQPAFAAAGAALALAFPRLATIVILRGGQAVLRNSAFRSSYELLYTPLPQHQKRPTKVVIDVACDRLGTVAGSGAVILVLLLAPVASTRILLALAAFAAALAVALSSRFQRGYVGALAASLRSGAATLEPPAVVDPTALLTLATVQQEPPPPARAAEPESARDEPAPRDPLIGAIVDLRSGRPERVRGVLDTGELDPTLVPHVIPLLSQDRLFEAAAASLRRAAARCTGQLVDALLDGRLDPLVRRRVARVLKAVPTQRAADGLVMGLDEGRFDVRYRCAQALLQLRAQNPRIVLPGDKVLAIAAREAEHAASSARHLEHVFALLALVADREPLEIALTALRAGDEALRGTALEYLDNVLPPPVREKLWPHLGGRQRLAPSGRSPEEIRDELLRSTAPLQSPRRGPDASSRKSAPEKS